MGRIRLGMQAMGWECRSGNQLGKVENLRGNAKIVGNPWRCRESRWELTYSGRDDI